MKYAVIGATGQLGRDLIPRLSGDVTSFGRAEADLTDETLLRTTLARLRPAVVLNCAAYNFVDKAESEPNAAFAVNAWGVRSLAKICAELDCLLVHFSSDYVFGMDSARTTPYQTADAPGPLSVYGMSKLAGEYAVRAECPRHFVIRTCGLYGVWGSGGKGGNFVETMLRLAGQGKSLRVVNDQYLTPSYTADVAECVAALIRTSRHGLYHITNSGSCSWYEFAAKIFELAKIKADLTPIPTREYPTAARRPGYSVLSMNGLNAIGMPRTWTEALAAYLDERAMRLTP